MVYTSLFELFTIGIGPSSSHTVGPMVAAKRFAAALGGAPVASVEVGLFGSLALTGEGHGTRGAVMMGLGGYEPATVPMHVVQAYPQEVASNRSLLLNGHREVSFDPAADLVAIDNFHSLHANVLRLRAVAADGATLTERTFASIGGGFILEEGEAADGGGAAKQAVPCHYTTGAELLALCDRERMSIADVAMANERAWRDPAEVAARIDTVTAVMAEVIERGETATGLLPGSLGVRRRAAALADQLANPTNVALPPTQPSDWAGVWATAVGEENAAGHRVVTAPTNGAAGIIPAVLRFLGEFCRPPGQNPEVTFLLTAAAIGSLLKANAGISGAELGCQGEIGSAAAMAAAGLAAALGGSPPQVENAAEIAVEHNLGLTCDPLGGLVQVPCIERNAVGAVKAIAAASIALRGTGEHVVSLDAAIATLRQTGHDMDRIYKETSLGGLAVNVPEC